MCFAITIGETHFTHPVPSSRDTMAMHAHPAWVSPMEFDLDGIETFLQNEFTSSRVLLLIFKTMGINLRKMG